MKRQSKTSKNEKKIVVARNAVRELKATELEQTVGGASAEPVFGVELVDIC